QYSSRNAGRKANRKMLLVKTIAAAASGVGRAGGRDAARGRGRHRGRQCEEGWARRPGAQRVAPFAAGDRRRGRRRAAARGWPRRSPQGVGETYPAPGRRDGGAGRPASFSPVARTPSLRAVADTITA